SAEAISSQPVPGTMPQRPRNGQDTRSGSASDRAFQARRSRLLAMFWWVAALYDRSMRQSEEACLDSWRTELLRDLSGEVLEIGAGTGASLPRYPKAVTRLVLCEPDRHMRRQLQARVDSLGLSHANVLDASLDDLPVAPESFDAVVCSLVL